MKIVFIILFILGIMFSLASQIPAWLLGVGKPDTKQWKTYGIIAGIIWVIILILANTIL